MNNFMNNLRVSKNVEEYKSNLLTFGKRLGEIAETDVQLSKFEYSSYIYATVKNNAVEIMETDSGVWVEFCEINNDEAIKEAFYLSYDEAYEPIKAWLQRRISGFGQ